MDDASAPPDPRRLLSLSRHIAAKESPMPFHVSSPYLMPIGLLICSNVFMTFAWYGHLKFKEVPLWGVIPGELGDRIHRVLLRCAGEPLRQRRLFGGATQDHAGSDHAAGLLGVLAHLPQGADLLESSGRLCADFGWRF